MKQVTMRPASAMAAADAPAPDGAAARLLLLLVLVLAAVAPAAVAPLPGTEPLYRAAAGAGASCCCSSSARGGKGRLRPPGQCRRPAATGVLAAGAAGAAAQAPACRADICCVPLNVLATGSALANPVCCCGRSCACDRPSLTCYAVQERATYPLVQDRTDGARACSAREERHQGAGHSPRQHAKGSRKEQKGSDRRVCGGLCILQAAVGASSGLLGGVKNPAAWFGL